MLSKFLRFHGNRVLSLPEAGFQQRLDLLLTRPQTVLRGERSQSFRISLGYSQTETVAVTEQPKLLQLCAVNFKDGLSPSQLPSSQLENRCNTATRRSHSATSWSSVHLHYKTSDLWLQSCVETGGVTTGGLHRIHHQAANDASFLPPTA